MNDLISQETLESKSTNYNRQNIEFNGDNTLIRGWLYLPEDKSKQVPVIVMAHGFGSLKEMHLDKYAEVFVNKGFAVIVFDYRGFGDSDGLPRNEVNPWQQVEDYRHAITFATTVPEIDENQIGIWGTSFSGGHVFVVAATDSRVKCVVSQVPTTQGSESSLRRVPAEKQKELYETFAEDRKNRMRGNEAEVRTLVSYDAKDSPVYGSSEAVKWYLESGEMSQNWANEVTLRSVEYSRSYDPGYYISQISPIPLLLIVGTEDKVTPTDLTLQAYENALEPKKLKLFQGGHFEPYIKGFEFSSNEAAKWFEKYLKINIES